MLEALRAVPRRILVGFLCTLVVVAGVSVWLGRSLAPEAEMGAVKEQAPAKASVYYCPMHPQIRLPHEGKCTICGMDLVPLEDSSDPGPRALSVSEAAMSLADIETAHVTRRAVSTTIDMVGKVEFDETRVKTISAWVPGRLDRLYVDYTGVPVKESEHLVDIYSPDLYAAQQELLEALKGVKRLEKSDSDLVLESSRKTVESVREKLSLWGLSARQIRELERQDEPRDHITVTAPAGGVVIEKLANQGDYVKTGTPIYRIVDLSRVWIMLDAYESDIDWLRYGQEVRFTTESYPGVTFKGRIDFLDWVVKHHTRTIKVRVNVDNSEGRLKPGMFVRAQVDVELSSAGVVSAPSLEGKWICPMHPDVIADSPEDCSVCGMDLVKGTELFGPLPEKFHPPLVIPRTAPLMTGKRAVVYVKRPDPDAVVFEGREIVLGPRAGEHYVVLSGLDEGEEVAVRGNFKIDSALQIMAKPSMMNPTGGAAAGEHKHDHGAEPEVAQGDSAMPGMMQVQESTPEFQANLKQMHSAYDELRDALVKGDRDAARQAFKKFGLHLERVSITGFDKDAQEAWVPLRRKAENEVALASTVSNLTHLRDAFRNLSTALVHIEHTFGHTDGTTLFEAHCPMAFDGEGASWLQREEAIRNPYFGDKMLRCGEIQNRYGSRPAMRASGVPSEFQLDLGKFFEGYAEIQRLLASDASPQAVSAAATKANDLLKQLTAERLPDPGRGDWSTKREAIVSALQTIERAGDTESQRTALAPLSTELLAALRKFGHRAQTPVVEMFCPMALNNKGAMWLQDNEELKNPYFGASMLRCGETRRTHPAVGKPAGDEQ